MSPESVRPQLDLQLHSVQDQLVEVMRMVSIRLASVTDALLNADVAAADVLIAGDDEIDLMMVDVEDQCLSTLATQQPVASDLRFLIASLYMAGDAERSADLIVNIAKAVGRLQGARHDDRLRNLIVRMSDQGRMLFDRAAEALADHDMELAGSIDALDDVLDELHVQYIEAVLLAAARGDAIPQHAVQMAVIGRFYERIGDHAENIGERIQFAISGWRPERAAADRARARIETDDPPVIRSRGVAVIDSPAADRRIDAIRRDFVANVSHELKTPVGALSLLTDALKDEDDEATRGRLLGLAGREVGRLEHIIDDLIELARLEDHSQTGETMGEVAADDVVVDAVEATEALARQSGIEVAVSGLPSRVQLRGDRRQLVRALSSLIDNAIRYSDEGSQVTVGVVVLPEQVELSVRDEGIGIERVELERIFERFYRVDRARSRDTGGTGLGLSIVRHVVDNHDARVLVDSKLGEGSTFTMQLPRKMA